LEKHKRLNGVNRAVAVIFAVIWLSGGVTALVLGFIHGRWLLVSLSPLALLYSSAWIRVAISGHLLNWQEVLAPWRA
jgi:hypothetical protein